MDQIWDRKPFEVGVHWLLWRGWKTRMTTQNRQKSNANQKKSHNNNEKLVPMKNEFRVIYNINLFWKMFLFFFQEHQEEIYTHARLEPLVTWQDWTPVVSARTVWPAITVRRLDSAILLDNVMQGTTVNHWQRQLHQTKAQMLTNVHKVCIGHRALSV